jgi:tagatose-6-phosphate ketose/aldose isomerase
MNAFELLLALEDEEKKRMGVEHTPGEIAQQPRVWLEALDILRQERGRILAFMNQAGMAGAKTATVFLSGAGSSEYVGNCLANTLRVRLQREVLSVPSTDFVTHAESFLLASTPYALVSFARSGDSPESLATSRLLSRLSPQTCQLAVTCNRAGALAKVVGGTERGFNLFLPEKTNDKSLVMTSAFSTLALVGLGLGFLHDFDRLESSTARAARAAERVLGHYGDGIREFANKSFSRACYLGTACLYGTMEECRLKMLEMSNGMVSASAHSYLGLRHGPQVFVDRDCVVVAAVSTDPHRRRYEVDLLRELRDKRQGKGFLLICDRAGPELRTIADMCVELSSGEEVLEDEFRVLTDVVVGQVLATFKSLALGLKPDSPCEAGTISRVVQGVKIYE